MERYKLAKLVEKSSIDERWYVEYNYLHPESGKFKSPAFRVFISTKLKTKVARRKKAQEVIDHINNKLLQGWNPYSSDEKRFISVFAAMDFVLDYKKATLRKRSFETYKNMITTFQRFLVEKGYQNTPCGEFNVYKAREFMDWAKIRLKITNRTYNNYTKHLRTFFHLLISREYATVNPFSKIEKLEVEDAEILCFTKDELNLIKQTLPEFDPPLFMVSLFIFYTFIRPTELTRLRIENIDMMRKVINIPGSSSKNKKNQSVAMPEQFLTLLNEFRLEKYPKHYYLVSTGLTPGAKLITGNRISERWRKYADAFNVDPRKTIYHLKHTGAGMAVEMGVNVRDLQLHLRHSSLEMTQVYLEKFNKIGGDSIRNNFPTF